MPNSELPPRKIVAAGDKPANVYSGLPPIFPCKPVVYQEDRVADLVLGHAIEGDDAAALQRIAALISPFCLVGWDTGGQSWNP